MLDAGCGRDIAADLVPRPDRPLRRRRHPCPGDAAPYLDEFATVDLCGDGASFPEGLVRSGALELHGGALRRPRRGPREPVPLAATGRNARDHDREPAPPVCRGVSRLPGWRSAAASAADQGTAADAHPLVGRCNDPEAVTATLADAGLRGDRARNRRQPRTGVGPPAADIRPGAGRRPHRAGQPEPSIHDPRGRAEAGRLTATFTFGAGTHHSREDATSPHQRRGRPGHHQPPARPRIPRPRAPDQAANRHQRDWELSFSRREMITGRAQFPGACQGTASPRGPTHRWRPCPRDTLGKSIEPRPASGTSVACTWRSLHDGTSSARIRRLPPDTHPGDAGRIRNAGSCIVGRRCIPAELRGAFRSSRASVGLMESRT